MLGLYCTMDTRLCFAAAPLPVRAASRYLAVPLVSHSSSNLQCRPRRSRARIVSLGAAPASPSPADGGENERSEAVESMDPVNPVDPVDPVEAQQGDDAPSRKSADSGHPASSAENGVEDILNSPAFLKKKLEVLQKELAEARGTLDAAHDKVDHEKSQYIRLAADFENYRRRSSQDLRSQDAKSTARVCKEILAVLDNFERATKAVNAETEREKAIDGSYQAINKQLLDALVKLNVSPLEALGEPFNPEIHEAIQYTSSNEYSEGFVSTQLQRGYTIGETLIRPAVVVVSQGPGPEVKEGESLNAASSDGKDSKETSASAEAKTDGKN